MTSRGTVLVVLALLAFASTNVQAKNTVATTRGTVLTPQILNKILRLIAVRATDRDVQPIFANALGLTNSGQPWPSRQVGMTAKDPEVGHGLAISRTGNPDLVWAIRHGISDEGKIKRSDVSMYRTLRDGKVVTALFYQSGKITILSPAEAQHQLNAEIAEWAKVIDRLLADPKRGPP